VAELLVSKGYEVHGTKRRSSSFNTGRIDNIFPDLHGFLNAVVESAAGRPDPTWLT